MHALRHVLPIAVIMGLQLISCTKEETNPHGTASPVIAINYPMEGQVVNQNDTLHVQATFSDIWGLTEVSVALKDTSGYIIWHPSVAFVPGANSVQVNEIVVNNLSDTTPCALEFSAIDSRGYHSVKNIDVVLNGPGGGMQVITSQDFAIGVQLFEEAVHIADQAATNGNYGTCAVVTENSTSVSDPDTLTIDFGTTNCLDSDGRNRRGIIQVIYTGGNYFDSLVVKQMSFINYFVNDVACTGMQSITNNGRINSVPSYNVSGTGVITAPAFSSNIHTTFVLQQAGGQFTPGFADDTWQISGSAYGTDRDGRNYNAQITSPLIRNLSCWRFITQGIVYIAPISSNSQFLDYGNGSCDNSATVNVGSNNFTITLF